MAAAWTASRVHNMVDRPFAASNTASAVPQEPAPNTATGVRDPFIRLANPQNLNHLTYASWMTPLLACLVAILVRQLGGRRLALLLFRLLHMLLIEQVEIDGGEQQLGKPAARHYIRHGLARERK